MPTKPHRATGKPFRFLQANVAKENRRSSNVLRMFRTIMARADVAVLDEVETPILRGLLLAVAKVSGFAVFFPGNHRASSGAPRSARRLGGAANAVCIIYRTKRFRLIGWSTYFLEHGQAGNFPSKYAPFVTLQDRATPHKGIDRRDRVINVFGYHNVPGAWSGRIAKNKPVWWRILRGVERQTKIRDDANDPPLVGSADTNRPSTNMAGLWERNPLSGTHHGQRIDTIFGANCVPGNAAPVWLAGSDHLGSDCEITPRYLVRAKTTV